MAPTVSARGSRGTEAARRGNTYGHTSQAGRDTRSGTASYQDSRRHGTKPEQYTSLSSLNGNLPDLVPIGLCEPKLIIRQKEWDMREWDIPSLQVLPQRSTQCETLGVRFALLLC